MATQALRRLPTLPVTFSSSGFSSTYTWSIYVPTVPEQTMRITEVLPYSSGNTNSPAYNPLGRPLPESNSVSYDQYVEIVNFGSSTKSINKFESTSATVPHRVAQVAPGRENRLVPAIRR